jgi:sensor domain CHASE-containing protein
MANMSLRSKIIVIVLAVVVAYAALDRLIQEMVVFQSFVDLEEEQAGRDLQRVVQAVDNEVRHLSIRCDDWATWDDSYRFIEDARLSDEGKTADERARAKERVGQYIKSNLVPESFHKNNLNLLYICERRGKSVWWRSLELNGDRDFTLAEFPSDALPSKHPLLVATDATAGSSAPMSVEPPSGVFMTDRGPMLVSAKPILDSHRNGPARGTVIMGRLLSDTVVAALAKQTGVDFHVWRVGDSQVPESERAVLTEMLERGGHGAHVIRVNRDDTLSAYTTLADIRGMPALLVRANTVRDITARGAAAVRFALASTVMAGVLILIVLLYLLQRTVVKPIRALTEQAVAISRSEDFSQKLELDRADEIGVLSREIDAMMVKLAESRGALVKAARAAGMSEIATGVLHNVGNVLNSVNVSATLVNDKIESSGLADLKLALKTVEESAGDLRTFLAKDPRGEHLHTLLVSLAEQLESEHDVIAREAKTVTDGIEHIKELIQSQQSYAGRAGVLEIVPIQDQIEKALTISAQSASGPEIEIVREFEPVPPCAVDRHRLIEILVNLIQNARQAMQPSLSIDADAVAKTELPPPRLTLRLLTGDKGFVRIEVADTGVGIPQENLSSIFTHGFTTKKSGHGFGLHASANAATEMGGGLSARSDGPGKGATFVLDLPIRKHEPAGARS